MDNQKRELATKDETAGKKRKWKCWKLESNINIFIEGMVDHMNANTVTIKDSSKRNLVKANVNGKNGCNEKENMPRGSDFSKKVHVQGIVRHLSQC